MLTVHDPSPGVISARPSSIIVIILGHHCEIRLLVPCCIDKHSGRSSNTPGTVRFVGILVNCYNSPPAIVNYTLKYLRAPSFFKPIMTLIISSCRRQFSMYPGIIELQI